MGHRPHLREKDDSSHWRAAAIKKKPPFLMGACFPRVKLCAVRMGNAILSNDLYATFKLSFKSYMNTSSLLLCP